MGISRDLTVRELAGLSSASAGAVMPLPYSVPVGAPFQQMFGIGRTTQWQLIEAGEIESVLVGAPGSGLSQAKPGRGRRVIIVASYLAYMERQKQREAAGQLRITSPNPRARRAAAPAPAIAERSAAPQRRANDPKGSTGARGRG